MNRQNPPTEEEIENAFKKVEYGYRGLSDICDKAMKRFKKTNKIHEFFLMSSTEVLFGATIFFNSSKDLKMARESGFLTEIEDFTYVELEKAGRGTRAEIKVIFEYDTHENVLKNYGGNYFNRLR